VFPKPQYRPARRLERRGLLSIAFAIPGDLRRPVLAVPDIWSLGVLWTSMPETAIAEDGDALTREDDVRANRPHTLKAYRKVNAEAQTGGVKQGADV
jgi:hypothetical protein